MWNPFLLGGCCHMQDQEKAKCFRCVIILVSVLQSTGFKQMFYKIRVIFTYKLIKTWS
jgi:hypothetical protein